LSFFSVPNQLLPFPRHQTVAYQGRLVLFDAFPQQGQIHFPIRVHVQQKQPRISALRYMVRNSDSYHPRESCHAFELFR
jgi:hypothetical protein